MKFGKTASVSGLILFGTTTSLLAKIVYELQGKGLDGEVKLFSKPWAMTTVMFIGMTFCLPMAYMGKRKAPVSDAEQPLLADGSAASKHKPRSELHDVLLLTIPTFFDLAATVLMNVGLLSVTASVYQMMRGAEMLFAALFALVFLRRPLNRYHYLGLLCCIAGISLVGLSSLLRGEGSSSRAVSQREMLVGMGLIVASQAVQAAQLTFEDFFMADLAMEPMKIVGYEGLIGALTMMGVMLPAVYFVPGVEGQGLHEDALDTLHMIRSSRTLQVVLLVDMVALLMYNFSGMMVTGHLGAVFRTVLETMRTLFVWLIDIVLFYSLSGKLGESWDWRYGSMQLAGFVALVTGTLVYGRGDEESAKQEMREALLAESGAGPGEEDAGEAGASATAAAAAAPRTPPSSGSAPVLVAGGARSVPIALPASSFRAHMPINSFAGSYSRSMPRSMGRLSSHRLAVHGAGDSDSEA